MTCVRRPLSYVIGVALAATLLGAGVAIAQGGTNPSCRPPDLVSSLTPKGLKNFLQTPSAEFDAARQRMKLPLVPASEITYVGANTICGKAGKAYYAVLVRTPPIPPSGQVYVYKVGTVYVVDDPTQTVGEWVIAMTVSSNFEVQATYAR